MDTHSAEVVVESYVISPYQSRSRSAVSASSPVDYFRQEIRLLARLRAGNLKQAFGTERGAAAAASRALGVTPESARRSLAAAAEFDARVRDGAEQMCLAADGGQPTA
ncbi:hypothetical protein ACWCXX_33475 [Streptomyces sp. NPDC001732]